MPNKKYTAASAKAGAFLIGASAGGLTPILRILPQIPPDFPAPVILVVHRGKHTMNGNLPSFIDSRCSLPVKEAESNELIRPGTVYIAPANYHLLLEENERFTLCIDRFENFSRPSIDATFETAAWAYGRRAVGILLSGANGDGTRGLSEIKRAGGMAIVQDPDSAEVPEMPRRAIRTGHPDYILNPDAIPQLMLTLSAQKNT